MIINDHASTFAGYPVVDWSADKDILADGANVAVAIRNGWDEQNKNAWPDQLQALLQHPHGQQVPAIVVGMWDYDQTVEHIITALVEHRTQLPNLKGLFIGDISVDENEISWIKQDDLSRLWSAFPGLEYLTIRGGEGLQLGAMHMPRLKSLRVESGGLNAEVVRSIGAGNFPQLESLVIWLGTAHYGATTTIADLSAFYDCKEMPKLKYLGLCNSDIQDEVAEFIATAPVLERLEGLELSMGVLTDDGALALVTSPAIHHLKKLDLHYHFCTDGMVTKLNELATAGITVDTSEQQTDHEWRFVAVGE